MYRSIASCSDRARWSSRIANSSYSLAEAKVSAKDHLQQLLLFVYLAFKFSFFVKFLHVAIIIVLSFSSKKKNHSLGSSPVWHSQPILPESVAAAGAGPSTTPMEVDHQLNETTGASAPAVIDLTMHIAAIPETPEPPLPGAPAHADPAAGPRPAHGAIEMTAAAMGP